MNESQRRAMRQVEYREAMAQPRPDRPMQQPDRHFQKLWDARAQLEEMASRYPSRNPDYQVLEDAVRALGRAARHFGLPSVWFTASSAHGGRFAHRGPIQPLE